MLEATQTQPVLGHMVAFIQTARLKGEHAVGSEHILWVDVSGITKSQAHLTACVEGDEIEIDRNPQPVSGEAGKKGPVTYHAVIVRTPQGWKTRFQTTVDGPCALS